MEKLFLYAQRFNTAVISLGLLLVVGLVVLGGANEALSLIRSDQKTVEVPQVAGEKKSAEQPTP